MFVDQDEINALLSQASELQADAAAELKGAAATAAATSTAVAEPRPATTRAAAARTVSVLYHKAPSSVRRLLRLKVPVIVRLANRMMPVSRIRRLSAGAIIEFSKSVEHDLSLHVRNHLIGRGTAVKIGEYFGLRVTAIDSPAERVQSMGD